jgi:hypothetical protein
MSFLSGQNPEGDFFLKVVMAPPERNGDDHAQEELGNESKANVSLSEGIYLSRQLNQVSFSAGEAPPLLYTPNKKGSKQPPQQVSSQH